MVAAMGAEVVTAQARHPRIMADAAYVILTRAASQCTGRFYTDAQVLAEEGRTDLSAYRLAAREEDLTANFYLAPTRA